MKIMCLVTCHNRCEKTLASLNSLFAQNLPPDTVISVTLVDDGSTDGTGEAVKIHFPQVNILRGTGNLFWAGGMRFGWEFISNAEFDYLLVFNDDAIFYHDAVARIIDAIKQFGYSKSDNGIVIGASFIDSVGLPSYGGHVHRWKFFRPFFKMIPPDTNSCVMVDACNMNLCLISRNTLKKFGFFSSHYIHSCADFEYCLRVAKGKGTIALAPGYYGVCDRNSVHNTSQDPNISPLARFKYALSVKEAPLRQNLHYFCNYGSAAWPISFVLFYINKLFPRVREGL